MNNTDKMVEAKKQARKMQNEKMMPLAKFTEGEIVILDRDMQVGTILETIFNRAIWMHSYKVSSNSGEILEVIEWAVTKI